MTEIILIKIDDLSDGKIIHLLEDHRQEMFKHSPPESVHALDVEAMHAKELTFWRADYDGQFAACGALKELNRKHGEIKSMKTVIAFLRKGIARELLLIIIEEAKRRGYENLSLETGVMDAFGPAKKLYSTLGFEVCPPFSDYVEDPASVCMNLCL